MKDCRFTIHFNYSLRPSIIQVVLIKKPSIVNGRFFNSARDWILNVLSVNYLLIMSVKFVSKPKKEL